MPENADPMSALREAAETVLTQIGHVEGGYRASRAEATARIRLDAIDLLTLFSDAKRLRDALRASLAPETREDEVARTDLEDTGEAVVAELVGVESVIDDARERLRKAQMTLAGGLNRAAAIRLRATSLEGARHPEAGETPDD